MPVWVQIIIDLIYPFIFTTYMIAKLVLSLSFTVVINPETLAYYAKIKKNDLEDGKGY